MGLLTYNEVQREIAYELEHNRRIAIATIVKTSGSTPQSTGAKLLIYEDGRTAGTVGGGCVEADVWAEAKSALNENKNRYCQFSLRDAPDVTPDEEGMICGGDMDVFIQLFNTENFDTEAQRYRSTERINFENGCFALVTQISGTQFDIPISKIIVDESINTLVKEYGDSKILIEIVRPPLTLYIFGGGHVGQALATAGRFAGFEVVVIDDREEFASRDKFPDESIQLITDDFVTSIQSLDINSSSYIVIVTRGHIHDEICLREIINKPARYVGMIGSRRRTVTIRERLKREGISPELLSRVHAPIGLDIGGLTPEEIAISIMAEIIMTRRGGTGVSKGIK